jgi:hypothetical protein
MSWPSKVTRVVRWLSHRWKHLISCSVSVKLGGVGDGMVKATVGGQELQGRE